MDEPVEQDHYAVLDISYTATTKEIKKAARKLFLRYHPDKGGTSEQFCKVKLAEEVLTDEQARFQYDHFYPILRGQWQRFREEKEFRRRKDEADLQRRMQKAHQRSQEAIQRAQEGQKRAAEERLERARQTEARMRREEEERIRAEREAERLELDEQRRLRLEQEAMDRSEAAASRRRTEQDRQAQQRLRFQAIEDQLQEQRNTWSEFYRRARLSTQNLKSGHTSHASPFTCEHEFARKTGKGGCGRCEREPKALFMCLNCDIVRCGACRTIS